MINALEVLEFVGSMTGLLGSLFVAWQGPRMRWGFVAFLVSNLALIALYLLAGFSWLVVMQLGFTATSLLGIYRGFYPRGHQITPCPHCPAFVSEGDERFRG